MEGIEVRIPEAFLNLSERPVGPSGVLEGVDLAAQQYPPNSMGTTASTVTEHEQPGVPVVEQTPPQSENNPLARTGLDATTLSTIALALFGAGAVLVAASRRPARRG